MYSLRQNGIFKKLETWNIIIPLHDNDGKEFSKEVIDKILDTISLNYPGFTIVNCIGYWKNQVETFKDKNHQIIVDAMPSDSEASFAFFFNLKDDLAKQLRQDKIYVTKSENKEELLSFKEFFQELGIEHTSSGSDSDYDLAKEIVSKPEFIVRRLGYETVVLIRDTAKGKIIWERKICGLRIKSEFEDNLPTDAILIGADQLDTLGEAIFGDKLIVLIGNYEFQKFILEKFSYRPLVEANLADITNSVTFLDKQKNPIDTKKFIEYFSTTVFCNYMAFREENYLQEEIRLNVGSDGSMQIGQSETKGKYLLHSPAIIKDPKIQLEIIRCLYETVTLFEKNKLDPIALLQAKARNSYISNRAILRRLIKTHGEPI